ncbi:MAG: SCP2 sterol-binding domain-containing protein [Rhodospirillales bacterium]|nr:SCP2 sterol-binding domain-containing protein [Rhodospirillales bacterium]MBO6788382.1 SCP2 sterol-binding domain-containing protein [Rhodospirillales bacterium]
MDRRSPSGCGYRPPPPFSPVLLLGIPVRAVPLELLQVIVDRLARDMRREHPRLFERLGDATDPVYLIDPVDVPVNFVLRPQSRKRYLRVVRASARVQATATVRGSLATLLQLLDGNIDGDALFFSRDLVVEGDTEAIVALRNAVDGEGIDLAKDVLRLLGPFATLAGRVARLGTLAAADMELVRRALVSPLERRLDEQDARIRKFADRPEMYASGRGEKRGRAS